MTNFTDSREHARVPAKENYGNPLPVVSERYSRGNTTRTIQYKNFLKWNPGYF